MKIIHTSDWHIGRQFHNTSLLEDQRLVLNQLIGYIESEAVDALVIAGDIYDRSVPPAAAVELLDDVLNTLCTRMGVPVLLIPGNHDSNARLSFGARQLKHAGLHIFSDLSRITEPTCLTGKSGVAVNFYGIPYNDPEQVRHRFEVQVSTHDDAHGFLVEQIKQVYHPDEINVLLSHCFIDGAVESESERPLSIGGSDRVSFEPLLDFNYVALGHLHGPQFRGAQHIRYSGSILKYSFSEQHQNKGVTLVEFDAAGKPGIQLLPLTPKHNMRVIEGEIAQILKQGAGDPNAEDYLMVQLTDIHAILDAMGKLREVYPNVLHLEKTGIMSAGEKKAMNREKLKRGEAEMFRDFYSQTTGESLTEEQSAALDSVLSSLLKSEVES